MPKLNTKLNKETEVMNTEKNLQKSTEQALTIPVVTCRFLSSDEKVEQFKTELKALLVKFDAELIVEDFGHDWSSDEKIVVNFNWDEDLANRTQNGSVPDWVIGRWENGR